MFWGYSQPIELRRSDFEPFQQLRLGEFELLAPRRPELLLERQYGPSWIYPDPRFRYRPAAVSSGHRRHLDSALLTHAEFRSITTQLLLAGTRSSASDHGPPTGRVVSYFGQALYPLDSFVEYG
jgi:hypothetical protein